MTQDGMIIEPPLPARHRNPDIHRFGFDADIMVCSSSAAGRSGQWYANFLVLSAYVSFVLK